jgi:hypothetical protein
LTAELYPSQLPQVTFRDYFSDEVWIQSNTGNSVTNADVRNVTVTSNTPFGNVTVNVANHVIRFSGSYTTGFSDNVVYTKIQSNTLNSYYWLDTPVTTDMYSLDANTVNTNNLLIYQFNTDNNFWANVTYTLQVQYTGGGANDTLSISRNVERNVYATAAYVRSIYP